MFALGLHVMSLPVENLTPTDLLTLGGTVLAIYLITTTIRQVWPSLSAKPVGLVVALLLAVVNVVIRGDYSTQGVTLALLNASLAFLSYLAAAGLSLNVEALLQRGRAEVGSQSVKPSAWRRW